MPVQAATAWNDLANYFNQYLAGRFPFSQDVRASDADPARVQHFLEIIDKHANRLTHLIDDLLLLARIDSGRVELNLRPVELRTAAEDALDGEVIHLS